MIGSGLSIIIELIVSLLLVVTISYCFIVNQKLSALRADQSGLRQVIAELNRSTQKAERAIKDMRRVAQTVDGEMAGHLNAAQAARDELYHAIERSKPICTTADKLKDVDLNALHLVSKAANAAPVSSAQMKQVQDLKRQRLGFGKDRVGFAQNQGRVGLNPVHPQAPKAEAG